MNSECRIDAFIAGAEKAGTTSLGHYLSQHPSVFSHFGRRPGSEHPQLEFSAFINDRWRVPDAYRTDYIAAFGRLPGPGEYVIAKNVDIMTNRTGAEALAAMYPRCRIVIILRDPVERAYSSFWYQRFRGEECHDRFEDAIADELQLGSRGEYSPHRRYLGRGYYAEHLQMLHSVFPAPCIHVVFFDDLKANPTETLATLCSALDLPPHPLAGGSVHNPARSVRFPWLARLAHRPGPLKDAARRVISPQTRRSMLLQLRRWNSRRERPRPLAAETRARLQEHFAPHNSRLAEMLERDLPEWGDR